MVPVAHANDGGGSIRIPASECGLVGLKPTRARVSQGPLVGEGWAGGTIDGAVTRTVRDAAAILDTISAAMPGEPYYAPPFARPLRDEVGVDPGRLRVGFIEGPPDERFLDDPECRAAVQKTAQLLESLGHHVEPNGPAAMNEEDFTRSFVAIIAADTEASFQAFEMMLGRPITDDEIEPRNALYRAIGREMTSVQYIEARAWIGMWARRMADWWTSRSARGEGPYDVLLTPTLGAPPPRLGWFTGDGGEHEGERITSFIPYTAQFNMTGQPAVSLPLHWSADGLPVGVQLVAGYGREDVLVRLASQVEQAAPWADKRPPIHA
jgi:amidase